MRMVDYSSTSPSTAAPAPLRNDDGSSHTMPKARPKIKIIHIIAPEIIKTDVANFRDLVQRLTGKQTAAAATATTTSAAAADELPPSQKQQEDEETMTMTKKRPAPAPVQQENDISSNKKKKIKCEVKVEEGGFGYEFDHHNELWMDLNPGGFLSFLEEDVFGGMAADFLQPLGSSIEGGFCW